MCTKNATAAVSDRLGQFTAAQCGGAHRRLLEPRQTESRARLRPTYARRRDRLPILGSEGIGIGGPVREEDVFEAESLDAKEGSYLHTGGGTTVVVVEILGRESGSAQNLQPSDDGPVRGAQHGAGAGIGSRPDRRHKRLFLLL